MRVINGEHDLFVRGNQSIAASPASLVTGINCPEGKQSCFRDNGSGRYIVKDSEVTIASSVMAGRRPISAANPTST